MTLSTHAQTGFSAADSYDAHRPSFPPASVEHLLRQIRVLDNPGATIVDLAAGTGKFTEILAARPEEYNIIAVEPHDDMRGVLERKALPRVKVVKGLSTSIPLGDEEADAVVAAQAFHWFANLESLKEINRVLQPHGAYGMIWNIEDYNSPRDHEAATPWEGTLQDFIWSLEDDTPRYRHQKWKAIFDEQLESGPWSITTKAQPYFSLPLGSNEERWTVWLTKEGVWKRFNTLSQVSILKGKEREDAVKMFEKAIAGEGTERNDKGEIAVHGGTFSNWTTKIPQ